MFTKTKGFIAIPTLLLGGCLIPEKGQADEFSPSLSGDVVIEWQNELTYESDDPNNEKNHSFLRTEVAPFVGLTEHFFVDGGLVLEPFDQAIAGNPGHHEDIWFDSEGVFAEELKLNFENGRYAVWAGKFNPAFGTAWDFGRGIWSEDFAEDYEITEQIGIGAGYIFGSEDEGEHIISAATFFNDTTFLSDSLITARERHDKKDGGAGNTEDFSSFSVAMDGENVFGIEDLTYHAAYRFLGAGDADGVNGDDERGVAIGAGYVFPVNDDLEIDLKAEYATIASYGGVRDGVTGNFHDHDYLYGSVITRYQQWNLALGYTARNIDRGNGFSDMNDHLVQVSGGYDFNNGLTAEVGYRGTEEGGVDSDMAGFLLRYMFEF